MYWGERFRRRGERAEACPREVFRQISIRLARQRNSGPHTRECEPNGGIEDVERIARRVFGSAHPITMIAERELRYWRAVLRARETPGDSDA